MTTLERRPVARSNNRKPPTARKRVARPPAPAHAPVVVATKRRDVARIARRAALVGAILAVAWLAAVAVNLWSVARDARAGIRHVERVRALSLAELGGRGMKAASTELARAADRFAAAASHAGSPLLAPLRVVPVGGRQVHAARHLSLAAHLATRAGADALADARHALAANDPSVGPARVALLREFSRIAARLDERLRTLDLGPSDGLVGPVSSARRRAALELSSLRWGLGGTAAGAEAVADLLAGPNRYLLFAANNAEMRAGSGAFLRGGVLTTRDGRLAMGPIVAADDFHLPGDGVPVTGEYGRAWGWLHARHEWRNGKPPVNADPLGVSPRFSVAAQLATRMWKHRNHSDVDGIIAVDAQALAAVLRVTGPVGVAGRRIDSANVVEYLTHDQYTGSIQFSERLDRLGELTRATMAVLDHGRWDPGALVAALGRAASGRHLHVWSRQPALQSLWKRAGVDGDLSSDSLLASVINRGGNKLDRFLDITGSISTAAAGPRTEVRVRLTLRNTVPVGEPRYIAGPHPQSGVGEGVYTGIATLHVPGAAEHFVVTGAKPGVWGRDGSSAVLGAGVTIPRGARLAVEFRFTLPRGVHALRLEPSARVPGIRWHAGGATFVDAEPRKVPL